MHSIPWNLDQTCLLTRRELSAVIEDCTVKARRSDNGHRNLIIARLSVAAGCAFRRSADSR